MKPNWNKAPDWADWFAMDKDGKAYWYEHEPIRTLFGHWTIGTRTCLATAQQRSGNPNWYDSKEPRPKESEGREMKPNYWAKAPEWAQWCARDKNGAVFWYEEKPEKGPQRWYTTFGRSELAKLVVPSWDDSLEKRNWEEK